MQAKLIQVIKTEEKRGEGKEDDPVRLVTQYWSTDGTLLAERDPLLESVLGEFADAGGERH